MRSKRLCSCTIYDTFIGETSISNINWMKKSRSLLTVTPVPQDHSSFEIALKQGIDTLSHTVALFFWLCIKFWETFSEPSFHREHSSLVGWFGVLSNYSTQFGKWQYVGWGCIGGLLWNPVLSLPIITWTIRWSSVPRQPPNREQQKEFERLTSFCISFLAACFLL